MDFLALLFLMTLNQGIEAYTDQNIEERVGNLEALFKHQAGLMTIMENENKAQKMEIELLKHQVIRMEVMEKKIDDQYKEINELKYKVNRIQSEAEKRYTTTDLTRPSPDIKDAEPFSNNSLSKVTHFKHGVQMAESAYKHSKDTHKTHNTKRVAPESHIRSVQNGFPSNRESSTKTAFYAYFSKNEPGLGKHHTLVFDTVKTNLNNGYSGFTGVFTVPAAGTYVFTFSIRLYSYNQVSFEIVKNAEVAGTFINEHNNDSEQNTITGLIVINVNQGDVVYVRTHPTYPNGGDLYSDTNGRSSFSGWSI